MTTVKLILLKQEKESGKDFKFPMLNISIPTFMLTVLQVLMGTLEQLLLQVNFMRLKLMKLTKLMNIGKTGGY